MKLTRSILIIGVLAGILAPRSLFAKGSGDEVAVIYNRRVPESKKLAYYYASRRQVPTSRIFGFDLPITETMTRTEYRDQLQTPLLETLEKEGLFSLETEIRPATRERPGDVLRKVVAAQVRYAALCYGVPVRILRDTNLVERGEENVRGELRRNEAAVDSELTCLPLSGLKLPLFGPLHNQYYGATNPAIFHPTNGLLLVSRLDGPSFEIARGLVDKALQAEKDGLWGRAYFDARGITNGEYKLGDDWVRGAAQIARRLGLETILDDNPETFPASFPMSQIAFYAGWYDGSVSGPFSRPGVEFMPGAFAYHLHSYSAHSIKTTNAWWVGPLLAQGATATMGSVDEPYLMGTPDVATFLDRFLKGFTFAEAACAASQTLSWQTTIIGDPLYCPFGKGPQTLHEELVQRKSPLLEWSHLRVVNLNLALGRPPAEMIRYLGQVPDIKQSALLQEKLGDLYYAQAKLSDALETYPRVLALKATPQQRIRVILNLGRLSALFSRESQAYDYYQRFIKEFPDYPDILTVYRKALPLAQQLKKNSEAAKIQKEIDRLAPPPPPATPPTNTPSKS